MATTHSTEAQNAASDAVVDLLDAGAGAGTCVIKTSGDVEVATCTFSDPAFGNASSGIATASAITSDTSATGGVAAKFVCQDSDTNAVVNGSVTGIGGGGDMEASTTTVPASGTFSITTMTYQALSA